MMQSGPMMSSPEHSKVSASQQRKRWLLRLLFIVIFFFVLFVAYWWLLGSRIVSTDNAYTATEVAQVAATVDGTIKGVLSCKCRARPRKR